MLRARNDQTSIGRIALRMYCALILWFIMSRWRYSRPRRSRGEKPANPVQSPSGPVSAKDIGPTGSSIRPYSPAGRDPFRRWVPPKASAGKNPVGRRQGETTCGYPTSRAKTGRVPAKVAQLRSQRSSRTQPGNHSIWSASWTSPGCSATIAGFGAFLRAQPTGTTLLRSQRRPLLQRRDPPY